MNRVTRRGFVGGAVAGAAVLRVGGADKQSLRVALIGCGDRGAREGQLISECCKERVVALVDPDPARTKAALGVLRKKMSESDVARVRIFSDYRKLFDEMGGEVDAAVIATPNHHHALPALMAIRRGIHVYVEKPLAHTIAEARILREEARKAGVATQLGNQGHSNEGCRRLYEYVRAGAIGQVREVYCWTQRCNGLPSGHVSPELELPAGFDWESWLGGAPERKFHDDLHPHNWHLWRDFGNGSIGNIGCHVMDPAFWALGLGAPESVEAEDIFGGSDQTWPIRTRLRWDFPARGEMEPVKVYWYDGLAEGLPYDVEHVQRRWRNVNRREWQNVPPLVVELEKKFERNLGPSASLLVGDKGYMWIDEFGDSCRIVPEEAHRATPIPEKTLARIKGTHQEDFFRACRGGVAACSNFEYSGPLAEIALLGNLAMRAGVGKKLLWDSKAMRVTNNADSNQYISREYRKGWEI